MPCRDEIETQHNQAFLTFVTSHTPLCHRKLLVTWKRNKEKKKRETDNLWQ